ncbi:MAG: fused MFS/spermidine synthase [Anaerolineae bacterium]|nr:fused MFS/spermidine synthase [Anaerolineae bacterium]
MEPKANPTYLYLVAFVSGMASLGVELSASRLLAPYFGESHPVWAAIIGLILLYLTVGYFVGGRWADRSPHPKTLYQVVAWAALLVGLVPFISRPILLVAIEGFSGYEYNLFLLVGPFVAVLLLFAAPITLMGCVSPFVIRLLIERVEQAGHVAGRTYAISTAGSLLGTFLPVFALIPAFGTRYTFLAFSLLMLAVALLGLFRVDRKLALLYLAMPVLLLSLAFLLHGQSIKPNPDAIYESESAYHYIQVTERDGWRELYLNEGGGVHSVYHPDQSHVWGTWDYFVIAPFFNPPPFTADDVESLAMIGLAGGTIPKQYTHFFGPIPIDGVEIDPEVVEVGRTYFDMNEPNLTVHVGDGRVFLERSDRLYTVIAIDAYRLPYIPWHLTTVEFFRDVRAHLTDEGIVAINVGHTSDYRLVETMIATLSEVFPSIHAIDVPASFNTIVVATVQPTEAENLLQNRALMTDPLLQSIVDEAWGQMRTIEPGDVVLTDDRAPVEMLTHLVVLSYVLEP